MSEYSYYQVMLQEMPAGIERDILRELLWHVGLENAITGEKLAAKLRIYYPEVKDLKRKMRLGIQNLRNDKEKGIVIASSAGSEGNVGYYLPKDAQEAHTFVEVEFDSRIESLVVTKNIMLQAIDKVYGKSYQEALW